MAFTAELRLDTETQTWTVQEFHWAIVQNTDEQARPQSGIHAGQLHLVLDHLHHPVLDEWMANSRKLLSGSLLVRGLDGSRFRTVAFRNAYCVSEGLHFNSTGVGSATSMSVLISAQQLLINKEVETTNSWPNLG